MQNRVAKLILATALWLVLGAVVYAEVVSATGGFVFKTYSTVPGNMTGRIGLWAKTDGIYLHRIDNTSVLIGDGSGTGSVTSVDCSTGITCTPDPLVASGTIAIDSTVATLTGAQTLTNKTLTTPVISTPTITHIKGGGTPSAVSGGNGAGTGPTITLTTNSTDTAGSVTVLTGTGVTSGGVMSLTFASTYSTAPFVMISPANATTRALANASQGYPGTVTTAGFAIFTTVALADATSYKWNYMVIQ